METKLLYDATMSRNAKKAGTRIYKRDPATDLWKDKEGKLYKLDNHGKNRIDLIPVEDTNA